MRIRQYWLITFLAITTAAFFFFQEKQLPLTYHFAEDFDGNDYEHIYNFFTETENAYAVPFPFHQRVLVPFLAAQLNSGDIIKDFQWVNLFFTLLAIVVTFQLWRTLGFDLKWMWFGFIWLIFHWSGLIRLNAFDPITVDLPIYSLQALFLLLLLKRRFVHLLWLAPLATSQKESFIALMIVLCVYAWWYNKKTEESYFDLAFILGATILAIATQSVINYNFSPSEPGKGALITLGYHAKEVLLNPIKIVRWLTALGTAFSPLIYLIIFKNIIQFRFENKKNLIILFSIVYMGFGLLAGGDMTRIAFLGFPFIMTWLIIEFQEQPKLFLFFVLALTLWLLKPGYIPDPAFERELWQTWYPEFAPTDVLIGQIVYLTLILGILIGVIRMIERKKLL